MELRIVMVVERERRIESGHMCVLPFLLHSASSPPRNSPIPPLFLPQPALTTALPCTGRRCLHHRQAAVLVGGLVVHVGIASEYNDVTMELVCAYKRNTQLAT